MYRTTNKDMTERYTNIIRMQYEIKEQRDLKFLQFKIFDIEFRS